MKGFKYFASLVHQALKSPFPVFIFKPFKGKHGRKWKAKNYNGSGQADTRNQEVETASHESFRCIERYCHQV